MSADSAVSIAWDVFKIVFVPMKHQFEYVMCSKRYIDGLRKEVGNLEYEAVRVRHASEEATNNLQNIHEWVPEFLASAEKVSEEAKDLLAKFEEASKTCCRGTLPDPICRYRFSREAKRRTDDLRKLIEENRDREISFSGPAPNPGRRAGKDVVQSTTTTAASTSSASTSVKLRDHGVFESRALMIRKIMDALADNSNSVVGVYGMGGVGKSTLLDQVKDKLSEERSFDWVAKADVSKNPDVKTIQGEIAAGLRLTDIKNEETISGRAELLHRRLKEEEGNKKKVLIILDNLWEELNLKSVGIPCGHDNKVEGCKLLLTSRHLNVLQKAMGCDKAFLLDGLQEQEARALFERMVGDKAHKDEFRPLVDEALHRCAGVPFLIVAMAKRFKIAELFEWKDALKKIKRFKDRENNKLIDHMLQWSYDNLEEEVKALLRLCVVYSVSKPSLENLVRYGVGLGLFQEVSSMEEAKDRLRSHICTLQASALLLDSEDVGGSKMHDLVREFVASVSSTDHPLLVLEDQAKSAIELQEDKLKSCEAMCFPDMKELPQELYCPELRIFLLFGNNESAEVPDSYFNSMRKLAVLNLTSIRLTRSPTPFQFSENLHTLCLQSCSLEDVAILGKLQGLQILSIVDSEIRQLQKEIGQLVELRLLDLSGCSRLEIIEPDVLGSLTKLEELYMGSSFRQWSAGEQTPPTNASLIELNNMKNLRTLHVSIPDPSVLPKDLNFKQLTQYIIQIGDVESSWWREYKLSRTLHLKLNPTSDFLHKECVQNILCKTNELILDEFNRSEQSIYGLSLEGFPKLKHLQVDNSPSVRYILERSSIPAFKALETLLLNKLVNLEKICHNHISTESFRTLKVVRVSSCYKIKVLFPSSVVRELPQLEELEVVNCELMRGIVEADDNRGKLELPKLRVLELCNLPNIKSFFSTRPSHLRSTSDDQDGTQIAFFNGQQVDFPRLETLRIQDLDNLGFMFSSSMVKSLTQLRTLSIWDCKKMEAVIMEEERLGMETSETLAFPMLTDLSLEQLKSLTCFSHGSRATQSGDRVKSHSSALFNREVDFPRLETLEIDSLGKFGFMFSPSMVKSLTQLRTLRIWSCMKMEAVIMEDEGLGMETSKTLAFPMLTNLYLQDLKSFTCFSRGSRETRSQDHVKSRPSVCFSQEVDFPRLETLDIDRLGNLGFVFSPSMVKSLTQLRTLSIWNCEKMEAVIVEEEGLGMETSETLAFPMLTDLSLGQLKSLTRFSHGSQETRSGDGVKSRSSALFSREVDFSRLQTLKICDLDNLGFMFFSSMVKSLTQLRTLSIWDCEKMEAVIVEEEGLGMETSQTLTFPMLTTLSLTYLESLMCFSRGLRETRSQDHVKSCSNVLFSQEVALPSLKKLDVIGMDNIEIIWDNQVTVDSFPKLESLWVKECNKLVNVVPSFVLGKILCLESLVVQDCGSLEVVFERPPLIPLDGHPVALPLKELMVSGLPKLTCVWDKELHRQVQFQCLRFVRVSKCKSLTSLFPALVTRDLIQLEELKIRECGIVELIEKEEGQLVPKFVFPNLTSLELMYLTELKSLYSETHTSHWPALKTLKVDGCYKVEILVSQAESEIPRHKQPLFLIEKGAFPNLQELKLDLSERVEIWHGNFHDEESFCKLRVLKLRHLSKEYATSTCHFVESLTNLEELVLSESYLEEPTNNVEAINGPCQELKVILPFSRRTQHLKTLDVSHFHGLSSMFTPTIAEYLVALTKLRISNCSILTEVIGDEEFEEERVVAFDQLKYVELEGLIELRCFSSSGCALVFPLLEDVIVNKCPNMKFFSEGLIEAPKMERVKVDLKERYGLTRYQYFWKGNLNTTIQNMYEEMASGTEA